jgi:hypothetical protein
MPRCGSSPSHITSRRTAFQPQEASKSNQAGSSKGTNGATLLRPDTLAPRKMRTRPTSSRIQRSSQWNRGWAVTSGASQEKPTLCARQAVSGGRIAVLLQRRAQCAKEFEERGERESERGWRDANKLDELTDFPAGLPMLFWRIATCARTRPARAACVRR